MIEAFYEMTCNACGKVINSEGMTRADFIAYAVSSYGWKHIGKLDYCKVCVANGRAKNRDTSMLPKQLNSCGDPV